jgi:hypothetical protein
MQRPEFYDHPVTEPIQILQTHCSVVVLTGNYAYKLKKAVNFGFLDFSTLEKRHYFLCQELALNQPVAPDIYVGVIAISQVGKNFILASSQTVVEYTLKMYQFPQDCLLIHLFEQGQLTPEQIQELGQKVADFHQQARTDEYIRQFGSIEVIRQSIDDNYKTTEKYIGIVQTQAQYDQTRQFTDKFLSEKKDLFQDRQDQGKIRECHGDLHLKNICYWHRQIQLFDRIEFNEPFRFVDVMYDIAFTVMDLTAKGRPDWGNLFLNTYLEQTGDWVGVQVLPFYLSRQAYVRAKVTSMLLDDPDIGEGDKQEALVVAQAYYQLAWEYAQPSSGQILIMAGLSGSGKTTLARRLAVQYNALHLRSDAIRKQVAGIPLHQQGSADLYTPGMTRQTYDRLQALGILLAAQGFTVILDARYPRRDQRQPVIAAAQSQQIPLRIIHCQASFSTLQARLAERRNDISDATADLLAQQQQEQEPFTADELALVTVVDTEQGLPDTLPTV